MAEIKLKVIGAAGDTLAVSRAGERISLVHFEKRNRPCCLSAAKDSQRGAGYFYSTVILF